ncbi:MULTISPECIES: single-stranded DNA-binding protein [Vibrio harveyi group]|uniref:single-stranded DNA-binding protein n=1 Tax=Vibrio harveyi group TaxID=717610 RepID=UPI00093D1450|nr:MULTISPECIES: single-stranded DNA-binding protein [Vibrio harveyi group]EGQ8965447.1 single-stranded DNA-binding protein [Vibrio parahaemolyticus]EGQ9126150.1 single-stranded DNA-binding protein [Vibrio parahaemolyticus]EGQ9492480.1 single-stranded DNA-binding protein [Vibrio parahaemolyticus]EGR0690343.1 single-stranded DNA-binding protein [Vibrio parahaemolyticus]EGR0991296.1 single-stranded DNA-binding protein [Vibrio parahaemolyticus]
MAFKIVYAKKELAGIELTGYVNIGKPDVYDPDKPTFKFQTELKGDLAEKLVSAIDSTLEEQARELGAKPSPKRPYKRLDDGSVQFQFKVRQFKEDEYPFKVWDMRMNPITDVPNLTAGTVLNLNFAFYVSEFRNIAYIALQPTHIQIKQAKIYEGGGNAPTFGAGEGYSVEDGEGAAPSFGGRPQDDDDEYGNF